MKALIYFSLVLIFCFVNNVFAETQWDKTFGGTNSDWGYSLAVCSDSGYIITGYTESYGAGSRDVWLIKTDATGNKQWDKTFGGIYRDEGNYVTACSDGGYIITGSTDSYGSGYSDVWLIKTDAAGNQQWDKTFGGTSWEYGFSVAVCNDGNYIIAGTTYPNGLPDVWLIYYNPEGFETRVSDLNLLSVFLIILFLSFLFLSYKFKPNKN